jgi:hypothetical protein
MKKPLTLKEIHQSFKERFGMSAAEYEKRVWPAGQPDPDQVAMDEFADAEIEKGA